MTFRVKNWNKFQHFKDRKPPWVKLYRDILDDIEWHELDPDAAKALVMIWLIASENDGELPNNKILAFRLRTSEKSLESILSKLSHWLEQDDISLISGRYQADTPETEGETYKPETKTEADCPSNSTPEAKPNVSPAAPPRRADSSQGKRLPSDWKLPKAWGEWAMEDNPALTAEDVRKEGEKFRNHWVAKAGKDARKIDWKATWANWIRSDYVKPSGAVPAGLSEKWFLSGKGIEAKGLELGIVMGDNELFPNYKSRVYAAANITDEMVRNAQADAPRHV